MAAMIEPGVPIAEDFPVEQKARHSASDHRSPTKHVGRQGRPLINPPEKSEGTLSPRLVGLIRLRITFRHQEQESLWSGRLAGRMEEIGLFQVSRNSVLRLAVVVAIAANALGVGIVSASAKPSAVSGTIRLVAYNRPAYELVIANFNRVYPNVKVDAQFVNALGSLYPLLQTQLQAGSGPDVMEVIASPAIQPSVTQFAKAGVIDPLDDRPWVKRIPAKLKPYSSWNGKPYMWVGSVTTPAISYNTALFRQLGLSVPKDFGQLLKLCQTIRQKAPNLSPISWGVAEVPATGGQVVGLASGEVYAFAPNWNERRAKGQVTFAGSQGWRNALQRIVDLKNAKCFGPGVPSFTVAASAAEFAREASVMLMGFDSTKSQVDAANPAMKGKYGIFAIPGRSQKTSRLTLFPATGLALNAKSQNKDAAKAFIDFVAREKQNRLWATIIGATSAYDFSKGILDDHHKALAALIPKITIAQSSGWPAFGPYIALGSGVQGLFTGQRTIDDVLKAADAAWPT